MLARRIAQGSGFESGIVDLAVYDQLFAVTAVEQDIVEGAPAA